MTARLVIPLVVMLVVVPSAAGAQYEVMPDLPGGPPVEPSPACQHLLTLREEIQKHGQAIQKANQRKASVQEACLLFRKFLAAQTSFIRRIEESGRICGVPSDYLKQIRDGHAKALEIGKDVCVAAAQKENWPSGDYWRPGERLPGR